MATALMVDGEVIKMLVAGWSQPPTLAATGMLYFVTCDH